MEIEITQIREQDVDSAISCIQKAFSRGDPYADWVFDRETFSHTRNRTSLGIRCRWGMRHALFHVAKDINDPSRVLGVACWLPPRPINTPESWYDHLGMWSLWLQQFGMNMVYGRGGLNVKRYWIWKAAQAEAQDVLWTDEQGYYFCNIVTVLPDLQGRGIGRASFKHITDQADHVGKKCYLESSRAVPNMAIYERMGFRLVREMWCDDDGAAITLYCMVREPVV
ncbi:hypothetical protein AMS68_000825 [Peltaster fructicola]|uniref:N-acetyltransferase domain-containing protein n=1 Tax=Peltaster fructicola TaxID=286661 RepID=A0A6H0XKZ3_9PEZI|nr:hypothetical protein AMS68_000825 [Peltaster fructicola]